MRGSIGKMCERGFTEFVFFQLPVIAQLFGYVEAHRPVIVFACDGIFQRATLGMALNTNVVGRDVALTGRVHDIGACRVLYMFAAWPVTLFATDVPFRVTGHFKTSQAGSNQNQPL